MDLPSGSTRAILFDLVGVLFFSDESYSFDEVLETFDEAVGQCCDDDRLRSDTMERFHLTEMEFEQLLARLARKYIPFQALWDLLPRLKVYYRLGILNNGTYLTFPFFDSRYGLMRYFEIAISSGRAGIRKPDLRIYQQALEQMNLPAKQCLFMDDSLENVAAAEALGMKTIHWPDREAGFSQFKEWLQSEATWTT